jgi:hypothetical protein
MRRKRAECLAFLACLARVASFVSRVNHRVVVLEQGDLWSTLTPQRLHPLSIQINHRSQLYLLRSFGRDRFEIPLLLDLDDPVDGPDDERIIFLPSSHLPDELRTLNVYGMRVSRPVQQMVIDRAREGMPEQLFGQVVSSGTPTNVGAGASDGSLTQSTLFDSLVGAIGCTGQVLAVQPAAAYDMGPSQPTSTSPTLSIALCRGSFRFVVKEVLSSIPYPTAIVEELADDSVSDSSTSLADESSGAPTDLREEEDDDDEDIPDEDEDDGIVTPLDPVVLVPRLLQSMKEYVDLQVKEQEESMLKPLEEAILQDSAPFLSAQEEAVEEMAAVFDVFQSTLVDLCPLPGDRYYALAMMAAEMANLDNASRKTCLTMTNGVERMKFVLETLQAKVAMARARRVANDVTRTTDDQQRELRVGGPTLPSWARQIRKGMQVEYFWNEEYGWCLAEVVDEPLLVVDELVITLYFPGDGTTHRLPFTADDKLRWRPPRNG